MRWGLLGFKLHICHQDRFLLLYYSTSVTLRATCNNKGDNSLLTKPWIKVPKRSRTEYNRGKPASIIEAGAFNAAFICNLHPWEQRRQDYKRYNTQSSIQNERRGADIQTFSICCPQNRFLIKSLHFPGFFFGELSPLFLHVALNVTPVLKQKSIRVT